MNELASKLDKQDSAQNGAEGARLTPALVLLMAVSCGLAVANLYYSQPLLADIGRTFGKPADAIGLVSMLTQIGYAGGMLLFIPLGDIRERRGMIVALLCAVGVALLGAAAAPTLGWLYAASLAIGVTTVAPQMIVPLAAHLAPPETRGKVIGMVMSGLLIGILLARTISGAVGGLWGWRAMFVIAAVLMFTLAVVLRRLLPLSRPQTSITYGGLIRSLGTLAATQRTLREAALIGSLLFGSFSVFWTALAYFLEGPAYGYGSEVAGLFGLVGVAGAGAATFVGRLSDRIRPKWIVGMAAGTTLLAFLLFGLFGTALWGLVLGVILLDLGVQGGQVSNQARIFALIPDARSRINTVYMVTSFLGGALGSFIGSHAWSRWGWSGVSLSGGAFVAAALLVWTLHRIVPERASDQL